MFKRVMIDLETLGSAPGCVVLSVGAVRFDLAGSGEWFYGRMSIQSALDAGLRVEAETLMWWFRHGEAALEHSQNGGLPITQVLANFRKWLGKNGTFEVWGNGASFDNEILRGAFVSCGLGASLWERRADRCYRTMVENAGVNIPRDFDVGLPLRELPDYGVTLPRHHALRDAAFQAAHLVRILERCGAMI